MNRNITQALLNILINIEKNGEIVVARGGQQQKEILSSLTKITNPTERFLVLPERKNNIFAQVAETMWVLAGRNDLKFLRNYLLRADEFSDDGITWRAAYGPRIRNWKGKVDQIKEVVSRFLEDPYTKRAIISIYDPSCDFIETKDVPCNNWLHFIQRNGKLDLNVAVRANDAIWGFSGINFFEWSVLLEIVANSLKWQVGTLSWYVGTFHVYSRHYETLDNLTRLKDFSSIYHYGIEPTRINTTFDTLDERLNLFFESEIYSRNGEFDKAISLEKNINDTFFLYSSILMRIYNAIQKKVDKKTVFNYIKELGDSDFQVATIEYIIRQWGMTNEISKLMNRNCKSFFDHYFTYKKKNVVSISYPNLNKDIAL